MLGAGLLGSFGRILEKYARMSMAALDHFAKIDAHAAQYAMISKSLLSTAVEYLEKKEVQERLQRTESSAQLFGLIPHGAREADSLMSTRKSPELGRKSVTSPLRTSIKGGDTVESDAFSDTNNHPTHGSFGMGSPFFSDLDPAFLTMSNTLPRTPDLSLMNSVFDGNESSFGGLNLFPLLDTGEGGGHIDLAHYL